jgi:hypothetical protein
LAARHASTINQARLWSTRHHSCQPSSYPNGNLNGMVSISDYPGVDAPQLHRNLFLIALFRTTPLELEKWD